jgi:hypothetical protein
MFGQLSLPVRRTSVLLTESEERAFRISRLESTFQALGMLKKWEKKERDLFECSDVFLKTIIRGCIRKIIMCFTMIVKHIIARRNRRASISLSPILYLFQLPNSILSRRPQIVLSVIEIPLVVETQRRPGPKDIPCGIPEDQWSTVLKRALENHESYRKIAADYGVSREAIRRLVQASIRLGRTDPN